MSVKSENLENPERDLDVTTRDPKGSQNVRDAIQHAKNGTPMTISDEMKSRIDVARKLEPTEQERNRLRQNGTLECWRMGRDSVIRSIVGDE